MSARRTLVVILRRLRFPSTLLLLSYATLASAAFALAYYTVIGSSSSHHSGRGQREIQRRQLRRIEEEGESFIYRIQHQNENLSIEHILPYTAGLEERVVLPEGRRRQKPSILLMWDVPFNQDNLRGCPDWNCIATSDHALLPNAAAVFVASPGNLNVQHLRYQYYVHYSQESPLNSNRAGAIIGEKGGGSFYNMSLSYRRDTPSASPYGYTAKLARESRRPADEWMGRFKRVVEEKSIPMAWYVSHCVTPTMREQLVKELQVSAMALRLYDQAQQV